MTFNSEVAAALNAAMMAQKQGKDAESDFWIGQAVARAVAPSQPVQTERVLQQSDCIEIGNSLLMREAA